MKYEITKGSIADIMNKENVSLAESFLTCDCIILFDVSGSMQEKDGTGISRFDRGLKELKELQASLPGKVAIVQFADHPDFMPGGVPAMFVSGSGTDMTSALKYIQVADEIPDMRFIVISDGEPNNALTALNVADKFSNTIDTIYIGPVEGGHWGSDGRAFLQQLAARSGGKPVTSAAENIKKEVTYLLAERIPA